jgi:hypothetical protein
VKTVRVARTMTSVGRMRDRGWLDMNPLLFEGRSEGWKHGRERTGVAGAAAVSAATRSDRGAMIAGSTMPSSG